jgi:hypothetical protein
MSHDCGSPVRWAEVRRVFGSFRGGRWICYGTATLPRGLLVGRSREGGSPGPFRSKSTLLHYEPARVEA